MLERLRLCGFQCHDDLRVKFDPHVTTIVGCTDAGKSAIVRSLYWLCFNRPSGDSFIKYGGERAIATMWIDGRRVRRRKGVDNDLSLDDSIYKAMGLSVPDTVATFVNVGGANFQLQHDSPFWFSLTAGQVSKELNKVVNLEVIDRVLSAVVEVVKKTKIRLGLSQERVESTRSEKERLSFVPQLQCDYREVVKGKKSIQELQDEIDYMGDLLDRMKALEKKRSVVVPDLGVLEDGRDQVKRGSRGVERLEKLLRQLKLLAQRRSRARVDLNQSRLDLRKACGGLCPVCGSTLGDIVL